jgi:hypothetical protein
MSIGTDRVRMSFNPSGDARVETIKAHTAELIDLCEGARSATEVGEAKRLWSLAQTAYEEAAMWAVKAATMP